MKKNVIRLFLVVMLVILQCNIVFSQNVFFSGTYTDVNNGAYWGILARSDYIFLTSGTGTLSHQLPYLKVDRIQGTTIYTYCNGEFLMTAIPGQSALLAKKIPGTTDEYKPVNAFNPVGNINYGNSGNVTPQQGGRTCQYCNGSGTCAWYSHTYNKYYCHGSGICANCGGRGYTSGTFGGTIKCSFCTNGRCGYCHGTGRCAHCNGTGRR